ncbi:hypothetical protein M3J09_006159 [Ascochyta lentis]
MAYSPEADKVPTRIGIHAILNAKHEVPSGKGALKAYKEISEQPTADVEDLMDTLTNLMSSSRPASPSAPKSARPAPGSAKGKKPARSV